MTGKHQEAETHHGRKRRGCLFWSLTVGGGSFVIAVGLVIFLHWLIYIDGRGLDFRIVNKTESVVRVEKVLFGEYELELGGDLKPVSQKDRNWRKFTDSDLDFEGMVPVEFDYAIPATGEKRHARFVVDTTPFEEGCFILIDVETTGTEITSCLELPWPRIPQ